MFQWSISACLASATTLLQRIFATCKSDRGELFTITTLCHTFHHKICHSLARFITSAPNFGGSLKPAIRHVIGVNVTAQEKIPIVLILCQYLNTIRRITTCIWAYITTIVVKKSKYIIVVQWEVIIYFLNRI